jgi:hypothetical protein
MPWRYGGTRPHACGRVSVPCFRFFLCLLRDGEARQYPEVRIRFSLPYPRSGGASSIGGGRGVMCPAGFGRFLWSFVWFQVSLFWSTFFIIGDDCYSGVLVLWGLARRLPVCQLQQALLRQALPGSGDGGARTAARLRLVLVFVVVARWSNDLFVILLLLDFFVLLLMIINGSVEFLQKKKIMSSWRWYIFSVSHPNHSFKNRTGEWTGKVTGSLVHWSNRWFSWFNCDKKPSNLINN